VGIIVCPWGYSYPAWTDLRQEIYDARLLGVDPQIHRLKGNDYRRASATNYRTPLSARLHAIKARPTRVTHQESKTAGTAWCLYRRMKLIGQMTDQSGFKS
jgi:hypothetical protein